MAIASSPPARTAKRSCGRREPSARARRAARTAADSRQPTADSLFTAAHRIHRPRRRRLQRAVLARWQARRHRRLRQAGDGLESGRSQPGRHRKRLEGQAGSEAELSAPGRPRRAGALGRVFAQRPARAQRQRGQRDPRVGRRDRRSGESAPRPRQHRAVVRVLARWQVGALRRRRPERARCGTCKATRKSACCTPPCSPATTTPCSRPATRATASRSSRPAAIARPACGTPRAASRCSGSKKATSSWSPAPCSFPTASTWPPAPATTRSAFGT